MATRDTRGLAAIGTLLAQRRGTVQAIQWTMVLVYLGLLIWPVFLPLPDDYATFRTDMVLFAQLVFWGIWWPFVMVSMMLMGRVWCGVFCPEGALTEWTSRHGLGLTIPRWIRWPGWPFVAFVTTTVYGQMVTVYEYPKAALLVLGGSTVAAIAIGFLYGREKRVWCRYLCPANGVFNLLSRLAPLHYRVDRQAWEEHPRVRAVNCPTFIDIGHMRGNGPCHMCGKCSDHRDAVRLAARMPDTDIRHMADKDASPWDAGLLLFGMLGVATGAFQWSASPTYVWLKAALARLLIDAGWPDLLSQSVPWWVFTNYPETGEIFSILDGTSIVIYILGTATALGSILAASLTMTARIAGSCVTAVRLSYCLIPLGGVGLFLGLSSITLGSLRAEGWIIPGAQLIRAGLLAFSVIWSAWLLWHAMPAPGLGRKWVAMATAIPGMAAYVLTWVLFFFVW